MIAVVDYGMGNRRSVEKALAHVGAEAIVSNDHAQLRRAEGLVLPGVGAFPRAMSNLRRLGLDELLSERLAAGVPLLGICLGMQLAFESSTELGGSEGLGLIAGSVDVLDAAGGKLPHIGWNSVDFVAASPLIEDVPRDCAFYHVHSYAAQPSNPATALATAEYGTRFVTAVAQGDFYGVQFHPEKSSTHGLQLLGNFARICAARSERLAA